MYIIMIHAEQNAFCIFLATWNKALATCEWGPDQLKSDLFFLPVLFEEYLEAPKEGSLSSQW